MTRTSEMKAKIKAVLPYFVGAIVISVAVMWMGVREDG